MELLLVVVDRLFGFVVFVVVVVEEVDCLYDLGIMVVEEELVISFGKLN